MIVNRFATLCLAILAAAAQAENPPTDFTLREGDPRTGSHILRPLVSSSQLPLNKRYEELTPAQKQMVHDQYEAMGPGDEPPFPEGGLKALYGPISQAQQVLGAKGDMLLVATVGTDGQVSQVKALGSPDANMTQFASRVLFATPFKPALCKGVPCPMDFPLRMRLQAQL